MSDRTARILVMIALVPGCLGLFISVYSARVPLFSLEMFADFTQVAFFLTLALTQIFVVRLWRDYVGWSRMRTFGTALLSLVFLAAVLLAPRLLRASYSVYDEAICIAGGCGLTAIWLFAVQFLWWGAVGNQEPDMNRAGSGDVFRVGISIALIPWYIAIFILSLHVWNTTSVYFPWYVDELSATFVLCHLVTIVVWAVLWGRRAKWTARVVAGVSILATLAMVSAVSPAIDKHFGLWRPLRDSAPMIGLAIWLAGTAWLWRRPSSVVAGEVVHSDSIRCPQCNYNLKGLKEVHCPECGWTSTVDQLVRIAFENASIV